jgi:adenine-specific DNA methylase
MNARELLINRLFVAIRTLRLDRMLVARGEKHAFSDYFKGFEKVEVVRRIFARRTEEILANLRVEFTWVRSYMWVSNVDGHLTVSTYYLNHGDKIDIYLDLIHELVHVKQFMSGKELFDANYDYIDRPTEVEAYRYAVEEAKRLGLSDERICRYLRTEWMSIEDLRRLARTLNVKCPSPA